MDRVLSNRKRTDLNRQEPVHQRVIEQYVDLRSKCGILSCSIAMFRGSEIDVHELDDPAARTWFVAQQHVRHAAGVLRPRETPFWEPGRRPGGLLPLALHGAATEPPRAMR